jgi:Uma2 family endonuclease
VLTLPRRLTYDDYRRIPDDGQRYEILDGEVYVSPSPTLAHQHASAALYLQLARAVPDDARVYYAPIDVILGEHDVVQPDLVVVATSQLTPRGIEGPPRIVVEIVSSGRPDFDRRIKAQRYASFGVPLYWLVDPSARRVECFRLVSGTYELAAEGHHDEVIEAVGLEGVQLTLGPLWLELSLTPAP